jgi:hypothetical protein
MEVQDLKRVQFVTANYASLQGLKMAPLGLWLCLGAARSFGWVPWYTLIASLLALCVAGGLWLLIGHRYDHDFGRVRPTPQKAHQVLRTGILVVLVSFPWLLILSFVDGALQLPVSTVGLAVAALLFLWLWQSARRLQKHYLVVAALIAIVSLLPLLGITSTGRLFRGVLGATFGTSLIATGVLDHRQLVCTLGALPQERDDGAI